MDLHAVYRFQLSLVQLATSASIREAHLRTLRRFCPEIQVDFWSCMNKTLATIEKGLHWVGRPCCAQAVMPKCQQGEFFLSFCYFFSIITQNKFKGCAISASVTDLKLFCRHSDEFPLFTCIEEMEKNTECCSNANSPDCRQVRLIVYVFFLYEKRNIAEKMQL